MNRVATEFSEQWASTQLHDTQGLATATDCSSSPQIDKANANFSSHSTRNEGHIEETTTFSAPPIPLHRTSLFTGEQTYGSQVGIDELYENKVQSAHLPSDGTNVQAPPLVPVQRPSHSQPNDQATATSRPASQDKKYIFTQDSHSPISADSTPPQESHQQPSQCSPESNRVPTAEKPQTDSSRTGDILASSPRTPKFNPPPLFTEECATLPQQSAATNPPISSQPQSARSQSYNAPNAPTPKANQPIHERIHQRFVLQPIPPQSYVPDVPMSQAQSTRAELHQPQTPGSHFGHVPSRQPFSSTPYPHPTAFSRYDSKRANSKTRRKVGYVASDPFRVSHGKDKVDAASDGLTFDDIPIAESAPTPSRFYGSPRRNPPLQAQTIYTEPPQQFILQSVPSQFYRTNVPAPQASHVEPQDFFSQSVPPRFTRTANAFGLQSVPAGTSQPPQMFGSEFVDVQSQPIFGVNTASAGAYGQKHNSTQSQAPVPPVPSSQHSPIMANAVDALTPPVDSVDQPPFPSRPHDIPFTSHETQRANQSAFGPSNSDSPYPCSFGQSQCPQPFTAICPQPSPQSYTEVYPTKDSKLSWHEYTRQWLSETFLRQIYLHFLLRLPSLYFSRVARIFEEADMSLPEIKKMVLETASQGLTHEFEIQTAFDSHSFSPAFTRLASAWESFIDSVMREWKVLNIISVLLLSAILTILQIQDAAEDPLTRYTALFSLLCSLISLLFGCTYIIRFGSMRRTYKAAEWALEAKRTKTLIWWNVWIMLAMPAIWLTWSIILYLACIMSFVWRTGVRSDSTTRGLSDTALLAIRISFTAVLGFGVLYGFLIMATFQRYGSAMDRKWKQRIDKWIDEHAERDVEQFRQPTLANPPYPPLWSYPDPPTTRQPHADNHDRPPFDDVNDIHSHPPAHTNIPSPEERPTDLPRSTSTDTLTQIDALLNQLYNLQNRPGTTAE